MINIDELRYKCLYFTSNRLTRIMTKMAEEEFMLTGLSPSYAYIVSIVNQRNGLNQKEIGELLFLKPSTITRFLEKLEYRGLVEKKISGKRTLVYSTEKGQAIQEDIDVAWNNLHDRYSDLIGEEAGQDLTMSHNIVCEQLSKY